MEENMNAESAAVVQPQETGAESADFTQPQSIDDMSDEDFKAHIASIISGTEHTAQTAEKSMAEDEPDNAEQATGEETEEEQAEGEAGNDAEKPAEAFKTYSTKEEWQRDFDSIIGERLKQAREKTSTLDRLETIARDFYGTDAPLDALITDLKEQTAEKRQITAEEYDRQSEQRRKAELYDAQQQRMMQEQQQASAQKALLDRWETQTAELKKSVPDFDFEKALENKEFYDRVVKGYSVADAYKLTAPAPTPKPPRKPIVQSAARKTSAADTADFDVWSMPDKDFDKLVKKYRRGD